MITYLVQFLNNLVVHILSCATEDCYVWHIHIEMSKSPSTEHLPMDNCRLRYLTRLRLLLFSWIVEQIFNAKMGKVGCYYYLGQFIIEWTAYIAQILCIVELLINLH